MSTPAVCPCDSISSTATTNLPGLSQIAFRACDFNDFRRALLTPILTPPEQSLTAWQSGVDSDPSVVDLAVMMVEWWAYLADILTFYNERIANEDYLRTAALPETPAELIKLLGYRPRPAIGATGTLAALVATSVSPGQTVTLPKGLQFQSKPGPGGAPQTFEMYPATTIGLPDQVATLPKPNLIANEGPEIDWVESLIDQSLLAKVQINTQIKAQIKSQIKTQAKASAKASGLASLVTSSLLETFSGPSFFEGPTQYEILLQGSVTSVSNGSLLLLGPRDDTAPPTLITLSQPPSVQTVVGGGKQTGLTFTANPAPGSMAASNARLTKANQNAALWSVIGDPVDSTGTVIQLASLARNIQPNDWVVFTAPGFTPQLVQVIKLTDVLGDASSAGSPTQVSAGGTGAPTPIPVLHTQLTLATALSPALSKNPSAALQAAAVAEAFAVGLQAAAAANLAAANAGAFWLWPLVIQLEEEAANAVAAAAAAAKAAAAAEAADPAVSVLFGWVEIGTLVDQPPTPWDGTTELYAIQPAQFPSGGASLLASLSPDILLQDSNGVGAAASAGGLGSDGGLNVTWPSPASTPLSPLMQPPIQIFYNLLPVSCGKTVAGEILGSGDATQAGQSFMLSKSPVTYLAVGTSYASAIALTVNNLPWTEVKSFYQQPANAQVYVTREDSNQNTWVDFGDGVNGARLTTGTNNVVATYRVGGGLASPPAGKLTVIAQSYPGLRAVVNPVAVSGGSDPDPAALLKQYAPRSVLAFGSPVSVFDYQAFAAQAPGVTMATAVWAWDDDNQRGGVTVYVAGEPNVASSVQKQLSAAGDPNRPLTVNQAIPAPVTLTMTFVLISGSDTAAITRALQTALYDSQVGLFSPPQMGIGQALFDSQIEAVCLAVSGVVAIQSSQFVFNDNLDAGPLHDPGEGNYFTLDSTGFFPSTTEGGNG